MMLWNLWNTLLTFVYLLCVYACTRSVDIHGRQLGEQLVLSFCHVGFGARTRQGHQVCWQVPHQPSKPTDPLTALECFLFLQSKSFPRAYVLFHLPSLCTANPFQQIKVTPPRPPCWVSVLFSCLLHPLVPCAALSVFGVESVLCHFDFPHSLCSAEAVSSLPFSRSTYSLKSFFLWWHKSSIVHPAKSFCVNTTQSSCYCHLIF